jgi:hypothetical protein
MKQEEPSQMTKEQALYFLDQEMERIQLLKLRSDLTPEQKLEAARIGRIEFKSTGATRKRS